uniref:Uncharacterized protein n=1 Tax=Tanacetum cinerariifolium TaxID=118510 RepID=A0A699KBX5_TANCI|nr:hypothetical protein [Tanacetum cinerariifolium]
MRTSKYSESNAIALEDRILRAGNPVKEDQSMELQPHSSGVKIQDLMLNQQRHIQKESLIYQSLPQISDVQALPQKNMLIKIDNQCSLIK